MGKFILNEFRTNLISTPKGRVFTKPGRKKKHWLAGVGKDTIFDLV